MVACSVRYTATLYLQGEKKTDWVLEHPNGSEFLPAVTWLGKKQFEIV